jgi:hypothetical protein
MVKFHFIALVVLSLGFSLHEAHAAIKCVGKSAGVITVKSQSEMSGDSRLKLFELDQSTVYLTHKKNFYSLEMFIPSLEQRIYSEGMITNDRPLTLAIWSRNQSLEVTCEQ